MAAQEGRVLVTENVKDFARVEGVVIVCLLKTRLRTRRMDEHLAAMLDAWAEVNPHPYVGLHWPFLQRERATSRARIGASVVVQV